MDKARRYKKVINELSHYFEGYNIGKIARMSMIASTLSNEFPDWIFCGFYRVKDRELLEIGPYQSSITPCGHIKFSKGVCGKSAREEKSIIVDNVNNFEILTYWITKDLRPYRIDEKWLNVILKKSKS